MLKRFIVIIVVGLMPAMQTLAQIKSKVTTSSSVKKVSSSPVAAPWELLQTKERLIKIETNYGVMIAKLYDSTPLHRDNFVKLVKQKFYDSLLFHRVISGFMIQGGDPESKNASTGSQLGGGALPGERISAEFKPYLFHKRGVLAAARDNNPARASSNCQFYVVEGKMVPKQELAGILDQRVKKANPAFSYTTTQSEVYSRIGGTPFLDQNYTVFGEVISGMEVIDKIANTPKDASDRPLVNIQMKITLLN